MLLELRSLLAGISDRSILDSIAREWALLFAGIADLSNLGNIAVLSWEGVVVSLLAGISDRLILDNSPDLSGSWFGGI